MKIKEEISRDSEQKYEFLLNNLLDGIIEFDLNGIITFVNSQVYNILGYSPEEELGNNIFNYLHPGELKESRRIFDEAIRANRFVTLERRVRHKEGHFIPISVRGRMLKLNENIKAMIILRPIRKAEQDLKISEKKYRHLFEDSPLMVALANIKGTVVDLNKRLADFVGYSKNEFIGKNIRDLKEIFAELHLERAKNVVKKLITTGFSQPFESLYIKKTGKRAWIKGQAFFIDIGTEKLIQILMEDITEQKEAEQKLIKAFERETFYKNLFAHDINNILHNIQSSISLLDLYQNNPNTQKDIEEVMNIINEQVVRGTHLISNVRELSKLEEYSVPLGIIDARLILDDVIQIVKENFKHKNLDIRIVSFKKKILLKANDLLFNVFENILNNAVKYNDSQLIEIIVKISEKHKHRVNYIKFEFIDNGIGIHDSMKDPIFQEGYMEEKGAKGLGFGLSLVRKIIAFFNGYIWVEDKIEGEHKKGSNFVILIPKK